MVEQTLSLRGQERGHDLSGDLRAPVARVFARFQDENEGGEQEVDELWGVGVVNVGSETGLNGLDFEVLARLLYSACGSLHNHITYIIL